VLNLHKKDLFKKSFLKDKMTSANDLKATNNTTRKRLVIKVKVSVSKRLTNHYLRDSPTELSQGLSSDFLLLKVLV